MILRSLVSYIKRRGICQLLLVSKYSPSSALSPFNAPELYQSAHGIVLALSVAIAGRLITSLLTSPQGALSLFETKKIEKCNFPGPFVQVCRDAVTYENLRTDFAV
jgi:hypothetical protein